MDIYGYVRFAMLLGWSLWDHFAWILTRLKHVKTHFVPVESPLLGNLWGLDQSKLIKFPASVIKLQCSSKSHINFQQVSLQTNTSFINKSISFINKIQQVLSKVPKFSGAQMLVSWNKSAPVIIHVRLGFSLMNHPAMGHMTPMSSGIPGSEAPRWT